MACARPLLIVLLGVSLSACTGGPSSPSQTTTAGTTTVSTTTTSVAQVSQQGASYIGTITTPNQGTLPIDLSLFFGLPRGASFWRPMVTYDVTGGYDTGRFTGSVSGTLEGTPTDGVFTGVLTANLGACQASRNYTGPLTAQAVNWAAGAALNDCNGASPLAGISAPSVPRPPTTSTVLPTSTSTTSSVRSTSTTTSILTTSTSTSTSTTTTSVAANFTLSVQYRVDAWCAPTSITGTGGFTCRDQAPGTSFEQCSQTYSQGTAVLLDGVSQTTWTGCDSLVGNTSCRVTMSANKSLTAVSRGGGSTCGPPVIAQVSKTQSGGNWIISYQGSGFTPYAGWTVQVAAHCGASGSPAAQNTTQTTASGTVSGAIFVSTVLCGSGDLRLTDSNLGSTANRAW